MQQMNATDVYNQFSAEYDEWFERHSNLYQSELSALQSVIPEDGKGIEIGVGTGRFAQLLNIQYGLEPSQAMANIARQRGIEVIEVIAEDLPIETATFDFAIMVTVDYFLSDIPKAFSEVHRILKPQGKIILAIIDKNSELGQQYKKEKSSNEFYKDGHFHSTEEITDLLKQSKFNTFSYWQTLTKTNTNEIEQPLQGFGKGSFVVIKANKV